MYSFIQATIQYWSLDLLDQQQLEFIIKYGKCCAKLGLEQQYQQSATGSDKCHHECSLIPPPFPF
jgi:hypothetical protein